ASGMPTRYTAYRGPRLCDGISVGPHSSQWQIEQSFVSCQPSGTGATQCIGPVKSNAHGLRNLSARSLKVGHILIIACLYMLLARSSFRNERSLSLNSTSICPQSRKELLS